MCGQMMKTMHVASLAGLSATPRLLPPVGVFSACTL
jgi:hypothetical protein